MTREEALLECLPVLREMHDWRYQDIIIHEKSKHLKIAKIRKVRGGVVWLRAMDYGGIGVALALGFTVEFLKNKGYKKEKA